MNIPTYSFLNETKAKIKRATATTIRLFYANNFFAKTLPSNYQHLAFKTAFAAF
jgi:hypothetical protein